ncbi:aggregation factor core [Nereida sp. MMG025]|uniref:aggregation factor core n=1 Tax=Nereida sp. MMG025 TaxID=2909981 RepID=UPI001F3E8204|nr:aggregation factor core [Nereida sp. MMG025]MCF6445146.1 aggregation factor core [Nereida sp. MMG025]
MKFILSVAVLSLIAAQPSAADVAVLFVEGAPKDRFEISTDCSVTNSDLMIDLAGSAAGLIFDTTSTGVGVEVFQPLEFVSGQSALSKVPQVRDGDTQITLALSALAQDAALSFTIDVDDTLGNSDRGQIIVTGSEIAGARITMNGQSAMFDETGRAVLPIACAA